MSTHRTLNDWLLLFALVAMWGSSFMFNGIAVSSLPPLAIVAGRVGIAAIVLIVFVYASGRRLPALDRHWWPFVVVALIGNAIPFYLITWGQQVVESALAGILMAFMPLATIVLAHFLVSGEHMTRQRALGFAGGFCGIVLLLWRSAPHGSATSATSVRARSRISIPNSPSVDSRFASTSPSSVKRSVRWCMQIDGTASPSRFATSLTIFSVVATSAIWQNEACTPVAPDSVSHIRRSLVCESRTM